MWARSADVILRPPARPSGFVHKADNSVSSSPDAPSFSGWMVVFASREESVQADPAPPWLHEGRSPHVACCPAGREVSHPTGSKSEMLVRVWRADEVRAAPREANRFAGTDFVERRNALAGRAGPLQPPVRPG